MINTCVIYNYVMLNELLQREETCTHWLERWGSIEKMNLPNFVDGKF